MKLFFDCDIILDIFFERKEHFTDSFHIFNLVGNKIHHGYTSSLVISNLHYITRKKFSRSETRKILIELCSIIQILSVDEKIISLALLSDFNDFEDSIQHFTAFENKMDYIITRNVRDYKLSEVKILTPSQFIKNHL